MFRTEGSLAGRSLGTPDGGWRMISGGRSSANTAELSLGKDDDAAADDDDEKDGGIDEVVCKCVGKDGGKFEGRDGGMQDNVNDCGKVEGKDGGNDGGKTVDAPDDSTADETVELGWWV